MTESTGLLFAMVVSFITGFYSGLVCHPAILIITSAVALTTSISRWRNLAMVLLVGVSFAAGCLPDLRPEISGTRRTVVATGGLFHCFVRTTSVEGALVEIGDRGTLWCGSRDLASSVSRGDSVLILGSIRGSFLTAHSFIPKRSASLQNVLRRNAVSLLEERIPSRDASSLASALVTGERGGIPGRIRDLFASTGISHLIAVSGLHVGCIAAVLLILLRKVFGKSLAATFIVVLFILFYVFLTGARASTARAGIMGSAVLLMSHRNGRNPRLLTVWAVAAALLIIVSGAGVLCDPGAQMSFLAVLSILVFCTGHHGRYRVVPSILKAGIAVTLTLAPLVSSLYGSVSPVAPFATLISMPFMLATMFLGAAVIVAGWMLPGLVLLLEWSVFIWLEAVALLDAGTVRFRGGLIPVWAAALLVLLLLSRRRGFIRRFR